MIIPSINWENCERETKISKTIRKVSLQIYKTSVKKILEDKKFIYSQIIFDFVRESIASYVVLTNLFKNFVNLIIPHEENIKTMNECYYFRSPRCLSIICCFQDGLVYAVEFSHRSGRDLINVAKKRTNVIPIIEDARHPHKYRMLVGGFSCFSYSTL